MTPLYRHLLVEPRGEVFCVRLRTHRLEESEIHDVARELLELARSGPCRGVALGLGPKSPECLYSVFLAKLYWVQRLLGEQGVRLVLCEVAPSVHTIFEAAKLDERFQFAGDFDDAVARLTS